MSHILNYTIFALLIIRYRYRSRMNTVLSCSAPLNTSVGTGGERRPLSGDL